jgi:hypothetical protein
MKKTCLILLPLVVFVLYPTYGQQKKSARKNVKWPEEQKHLAIDSFPATNMVNYLSDWGGMTVAVNSMPKGADLAPLLIGLKNNSCQVPHWGYILKGSLRLEYDDGNVVVLKEGDLFYMAPGHRASVVEDLKLLDFSPEDEFKDLVSHLTKMAAKK